jgi:hypothetical protein
VLIPDYLCTAFLAPAGELDFPQGQLYGLRKSSVLYQGTTKEFAEKSLLFFKVEPSLVCFSSF